MAAVSVASTVASLAANQVAAAEEVHAINEANQYNAAQAIKEQTDLSSQEGIKRQQERQALANEKLSLKQESMQKSATAAASSNAAGNAYDMLMNEYARANANNMSVIDQQNAMQDLGYNIATQGYKDRAEARIGSMQSYKQSTAGTALSYIGAGLGIAGGIAGGFNEFDKRTAERSKKAKQPIN